MVVDVTAAQHRLQFGALGLDAGKPEFDLDAAGFGGLGAQRSKRPQKILASRRCARRPTPTLSP
ncbi:hypothetical protein, partial [Mesorhizobium sp.]|uniref:hypothetical protein n=1 Tax=Mesorhizobium sp. TaxID=1871066 RepID=UPI0025C4F617